MPDLISQLVAIRKAKGIKQGSVARRMGVAAPMISAFENGRRQPTLPTLIRYAAAVGARITVEEA
ncbi:helix-turn-helix transcriptional regulator [Mycolicibacterium boenickei]|nr:helix-turn-helix transcriptional regulator [Mycolicibacterium boenickei]